MAENDGLIRILSIDDHPMLRAGARALIEGQVDMALVAEASSGQDAISSFRQFRPDVTLMDLQMPGMNGIDAIQVIRAEFPSARIIALTTYSGDVLAQRALRAGAQAYLLKSRACEDLLDTIRAVHAGNRRVDPEVVVFLARHRPDDALSAREVAVLERIAGGQPRKLIARDLVIAESTVNSHVKNIVAKLGASDVTHAAMVGLERGIIGFWSRMGTFVDEPKLRRSTDPVRA